MLPALSLLAAYALMAFSKKAFGGPFAFIGVAYVGFSFFLCGSVLLRIFGLS